MCAAFSMSCLYQTDTQEKKPNSAPEIIPFQRAREEVQATGRHQSGSPCSQVTVLTLEFVQFLLLPLCVC